jgi:hypothetical protein
MADVAKLAEICRPQFSSPRFAAIPVGNAAAMLLLLILLAALVVLGVVLAVVVIKWLFILAVVAALVWVIAFFARGIASRT